jgi:hypothetical protein
MRPGHPDDERTLARWIQELEDGEISGPDRQRLMDRMRRDPAARRKYREHAELSALIQLNAESRRSLGTMPVSIETLRHEKRRSAAIALSYAVAAMLVLGLGLLMFQAGFVSRNSSPSITLDASADASYSVASQSQEAHVGSDLEPGDQVTLKRGLIRFGFASGVEAVIEGPSQLELISETILRMDKGRGWFRVPSQARGFTVRTEHGQVIDLGTEFGVCFDLLGDLEVHVTEGRVKVVPALPETEEVELTGGKALRLDSNGKILPLELRASLFRREFSRPVARLHWSFDDLVQGVFPAAGTLPEIQNLSLRPQRHDGKEVRPADCLTEGVFGKAFSLQGDGLFAESAFPGIESNVPRTIAAWVRLRNPKSGSGMPPADSPDPRTGLGATTPFGEQSYLLNYTNAGLTTARGATGETLKAGVTYTLTFHMAALPRVGEAGYLAQLVAFDPSADNARRVDCRPGSSAGSVLATSEGMVDSFDMSASGLITFTPRAGDPHLGKDLAIRLLKPGHPVLYDRLRLTTRRGSAPETTAFTEDFELPVVAGYAERTPPAHGWIGAITGTSAIQGGYGSSRHGLFSQRPVDSSPLVAWGHPHAANRQSLFALPSRQPRWSLTDGRGFHDAPPSHQIPRGEWSHVAVVHTGQTTNDGQPEVILFLDGKPVRSVPHAAAGLSSPVPASQASRLFLGTLPGAEPGSPTLDADIDELHIIRSALGEKEISNLMDGNQPAFVNSR